MDIIVSDGIVLSDKPKDSRSGFMGVYIKLPTPIVNTWWVTEYPTDVSQHAVGFILRAWVSKTYDVPENLVLINAFRDLQLFSVTDKGNTVTIRLGRMMKGLLTFNVSKKTGVCRSASINRLSLRATLPKETMIDAQLKLVPAYEAVMECYLSPYVKNELFKINPKLVEGL